MKKFWIYILVTFGFGWLMQGLAVLSLSYGLNALVYTGLLAICMFAPLFGTLAANGGLGQKANICWRPSLKRNLRWWLAAWFGPAVLALLGTVAFYALCPGRFDPNLTALTDQLLAQGYSINPWALAAVSLAQSVTYAPFLNMIFGVGEEAGWRGWMTPFLENRMGKGKALVLSGIIWGVWHWPIILLAGYNFGTGYWGAPLTGALMMCVSCVALGILLSWVYEKTQSIWAPALAHGAFNAAAGMGTFCLAPGTTSMILGPTPLGLVAGIPLFALAAWIWFKTQATQE